MASPPNRREPSHGGGSEGATGRSRAKPKAEVAPQCHACHTRGRRPRSGRPPRHDRYVTVMGGRPCAPHLFPRGRTGQTRPVWPLLARAANQRGGCPPVAASVCIFFHTTVRVAARACGWRAVVCWRVTPNAARIAGRGGGGSQPGRAGGRDVDDRSPRRNGRCGGADGRKRPRGEHRYVTTDRGCHEAGLPPRPSEDPQPRGRESYPRTDDRRWSSSVPNR